MTNGAVGHMVADGAAARRAQRGMVTCEMAGDAAHHSALQAAPCVRRTCNQGERDASRNQNGLHGGVLDGVPQKRFRPSLGPPPGLTFLTDGRAGYTTLSTSMALIEAMALAGFSPLGQTWAQFMMVWQR